MHTQHDPSRDAYCSDEECSGWLPDQDKWALFTEMAVKRFGLWQTRLVAGSNEPELPPLDVLLVWMTYLGSPNW
jgi:hypothetical protein